MVGHGGSSAGSYLADPTSPIPSHCASIVVTSTVRVNRDNTQILKPYENCHIDLILLDRGIYAAYRAVYIIQQHKTSKYDTKHKNLGTCRMSYWHNVIKAQADLTYYKYQYYFLCYQK